MHRTEAMKPNGQSAYGSKTPCFNPKQWGCRPKPRRADASSTALCSPLNPLRGLRPSRPPGERGECPVRAGGKHPYPLSNTNSGLDHLK